MDPLDLVLAADRVGIVAFAISGVAVGLRARMDLYGLALLGMITALGGGVTRDVVIDDIPRVFQNIDYLYFAAGATALAVLAGALGWRAPGPILKTADALGTGAFAPTGALLAYEAGLEWPAAIILAILTATGGGIVRDVLATEVPSVLHTGLNATASILGGGVTVLLIDDPTVALLAGGAVAATVTGLGHLGWVRMPRLTHLE
ncbi:MAG: TRIC cation channel family protein [Dehalococcoidia bacterium]|nr:TRIC cation channel family protein [Dehalococcoidia bacterium]